MSLFGVLVAVSIAVAVACSLLTSGLYLFFATTTQDVRLRKLAGAMLMGAAIAGMHYTAPAAAAFTTSESIADSSHVVDVTALGVAGMVVLPPIVLGIAFLTSMVDRLQESLDQLRALASHLETAREEERRRIAREIHDDLGQSLTAIKIELSSLHFEWPRGDAALRMRDAASGESSRKIARGSIEYGASQLPGGFGNRRRCRHANKTR